MRILREPLLHFLLLGAGLFVAYGLVNKKKSGDTQSIVVTRAEIAAMTEGFTRVWQRPPTADDLNALIADRVKEEVYCREAVLLGLDQDDAIIRRRLRQKMEFISDDVAKLAEPTDPDLQAWLDTHPESFRVEPRIAFRQVYFDRDRHGDALARDVAESLARLNSKGDGNGDFAKEGDPFVLEHDFAAAPKSEIAKQFGDGFANRVGELPLHEWHGPIDSAFGVHLVFVGEHTDGRVPALAEVRDAVRRDWTNAHRVAANDEFYRQLLQRYRVEIESTQPVAEHP